MVSGAGKDVQERVLIGPTWPLSALPSYLHARDYQVPLSFLDLYLKMLLTKQKPVIFYSGTPSNCLMFISVSPPILKLPVEFNDLLKTVLESTNTTTVDLSNMLFFAVFPLLPLSAPKLILIFSPFFFLVQKMEGPVKLRTVREAPTDCVCPPGKWMFDRC